MSKPSINLVRGYSMIKRTKLYPVISSASRIKNCPKCATQFKAKNVIREFMNYCYCETCKNIVEIKWQILNKN